MTEDEQKIKEYESNPLAILDDKTIDDYLEQQAQKLLYQGSQNAFSRGGQTLFLDFNVHVGVPKHLKDTLIILDGKYQLQDKNGKLIALEERKLEEKTRSEYNLMELIDPRTKEVVLKERIEMIGGGEGKKGKEHIIQDSFTKEGEKVAVYGDYNGIAKRFTKALLKKFGDGDEKGAPFAFPKCDFHINEEVIEGKDKEAEEIFDYACQVASKNGSVYFVMDRDDVTMSACCRLRTTIDDDYVLKHPESMRFCGFQNVTINLPQAAYRAAKKGKKNLEGFLEEIDLTMDLARKAHQEKKAYIEELQKPGGPQYQTGAPSLDGQKYVDLNKATYIIGLLGLNDALNFLTGKELHEMTGEELKNWGLKTVSHMNNQARRYSEEDNLNYSLEESPAESATRRMSLVDLSLFPEAKDYVKGNLKTGDTYYTNSIHEAADAPDDLITRIKKQGMFHPAITSGAITHAFVGEHLPPAASIKNLVTKTFKETQTAQLTISPEFTVCESCKTTHNGIYESCPKCKSEEIYTMSRIVGYFSQIPNWNRSKLVELKARQKARENYSVPVEIRDTNGMPVLASFVNGEDFTGHIYGKPGCGTCQDLKEKTMQHIIGRYEKKGVKINMVYHNVFTDDEMTDFLTAGLNPSRLPALVVIDRKGNEVYRQETRYNADGRGKAELITAGSIVRGLEEHAGPEK